MFKVRVTYIEHELTREEARALCYSRFGGANNVDVEFMPIDNSTDAALDFSLDNLITDKQSSILFGDSDLYSIELAKLKKQVYQRIEARLDKIISSNENRL